MRGITKRFAGVVANDKVSFDVRVGEVHTLFGENGAGKSTLMKVLFGLYHPDEGEIRVRGERVNISGPADAIRQGIGMLHQHFMLVDTLTVAENIALGKQSTRGPLTDLKRVSARLRALGDKYGLAVDPEALVWQLSVGERQRVEILKALYVEVDLIVLDEPTAVLTPGEVADLFRVLRQMVEDGRSVVFISHKINEVFELSDRITVLRHGRSVGTLDRAKVSAETLIQMMVGRRIAAEEPPPIRERGPVRLTVRDLWVKGDKGSQSVRGLSFDAHAGEIVGIAGVSGNGQRELAEAIAGLRGVDRGSIELGGHELAGAKPIQARNAGLAYVPEERMRDGSIGDFSVAENLLLVANRKPEFSRFGFLRNGAIRRHCTELVSTFDVRTPSLETPIRHLSGGNIQKLIMARELSSRPEVFLVAQPTRGTDVVASRFIHSQLIEARANGMAIVMMSEDLDEVMSLSDRILVVYEGAIIGSVNPRIGTREEVGRLMAGVTMDAVEMSDEASL